MTAMSEGEGTIGAEVETGTEIAGEEAAERDEDEAAVVPVEREGDAAGVGKEDPHQGEEEVVVEQLSQDLLRKADQDPLNCGKWTIC